MRNRSRVLVLGAAAAMVLGLGACGGSDSDSSGGAAGVPGGGDAELTATVDVADNVFKPEDVKISEGGTVTWDWSGKESHNVVSDDGDFESKTQTSGTFKHTFDEADTYKYHCTIHPEMTGTVEVS